MSRNLEDFGLSDATIHVGWDPDLAAVTLRFEQEGEFVMGVPDALNFAMAIFAVCMRIERDHHD